MADRRVWEIYWEHSFERSLAAMGLTLEIFEKLGRDGLAALVHADPYEAKSTFELVGSYRYMNSRERFPDLPPMLIAYRVDDGERTVFITGAKKIWDDDDYEPLPPRAKQPWIL